MKLLNAHIYGFGMWVDYKVDFPRDSFICIYGENESGKSTLQQFILFVLFGLPPKQRSLYHPKMSSKMGGRLTILDPEVGEYTIERLDKIRNGAAKCFLPDGREQDESWLNERINGITKSIYESIYSFDAADLSAIQNMTQAEIVEVLLGIGLTGSAHIYNVEKTLNSRIEELFKPFGKLPIINKQLEKTDELAKRIHIEKQEESTYYEKKKNLAEFESEKEVLQVKLNNAKMSISDYERQLQVLPYLKDINYYTSQLEKIPTHKYFPENGVKRMDVLKEKLIPLHSEQSIVIADEHKYTVEKEKLVSDIESYSISSIETILSLESSFNSNNQQQETLIGSEKRLNKEIEDILYTLNDSLNLDDIDELDLPFYTEKVWSDLKSFQTGLEIEKEHLNEEEQIKQRKQSYVKTQIKTLEEQIVPQGQRKKLEKDLSNLEESELLERLDQAMFQTNSALESERKQYKKQANLILIGTILAAFLLIISFFIFNVTELSYLSLVIVVVGFLFWSREKQSFKNIEKIFNQRSKGLSTGLTIPEQEDLKKTIEKDDEIKIDLNAYKDQLKDINIQYLQFEEKRTSWTYKNNRLNEQIKEQRELHPYLSEIEVEYWPEAFHILKNILRLNRQKQKNSMDKEIIKKRQSEIKKQLSQLTQEFSLIRGEQSVEEQFKEAELLLKSIRDKEARIKQLTEILKEYSNRISTIKKQIDIIQTEVNKLLTKANVPNEDSYYKAANQIDQAINLNDAIDKITVQFSKLFSKSEWTYLMNNVPDSQTLELEKNEKEKQLQQIEKQLDSIRQRIANVRNDLLSMEQTEVYSQGMHELDRSKDNLNELAKKWAILKTAKETLSLAKWRFQDKYLKRIIECTTVHFNELTNQRYIKVYTPQEGKPFLVEAHDHIRYTVDELSMGTIHQLYISLRLAISEIMNEIHQLPFIIDDAFVHFDAVRTKRILNILRKQSELQQAILFTCKPEIAACFQSRSTIELKNI